LPPDVRDAPNSIPGVCLSVRPSLKWSLTHSSFFSLAQSVTFYSDKNLNSYKLMIPKRKYLK